MQLFAKAQERFDNQVELCDKCSFLIQKIDVLLTDCELGFLLIPERDGWPGNFSQYHS